MSFGYPGQYQYGTAGGSGTIPDIGDVAQGGGQTYTAFLILSGPQTIRDREAVEAVIRIIGETGGSLMSITVLENGGIVDSNVTQVDFGAGVVATQVSPGVVLVTVSGITRAMITDGEVIGSKLADLSVSTAKLADLAVTTGKLNDGAVTAIKIADDILTDNKVAVGGGDGAVLFARDFRDTATAGRSSTTSTTGEEKLTANLLLSSPASVQKNYKILVRAFGTLEKTVSGNIEMRCGLRLGAGNLAVSDWVGSQFTLQPITSQYCEVMSGTLAGDSTTYTGFVEVKVTTGTGFFHGGYVTVSAIPMSMG